MSDIFFYAAEFESLLAAVKNRYGVDLTGYSRSSLMRRVGHFMRKSDLHRFAELQPKILLDRAFFWLFLDDISVSVTEFFRDPAIFFTVVQKVFPILADLPYLKIWHAGCASGQEAYSLAVLLHEARLLAKCTIYATDISRAALNKARVGIYNKRELLHARENYTLAGGSGRFSDYYVEKYEHVRFHSFLRTHIAFAQHDLVGDAVFPEINLLFCRNVFIYFERDAQKKLTEKFATSLVANGFLVLGTSESLQFVDESQQFDVFSSPHRIYQKLAARHEEVYFE